MGKLTKAQSDMLAFYERTGPTSQAWGRGDTWRGLIGRGLLRRSHGLGAITTEITKAGRQALKDSDHD